MKILITGCKGQLGCELTKQLSMSNIRHKLIETDIHNLDITNQAGVLALIKEQRPDIVINCAAYTNVDMCETDETNAFRINAIGAQNLSIGCYAVGASIVQISTDYVFDGLGDKPKKEYDAVNPLSCYGKSKALGEMLVRETNPRHYIVRTAWLYGQGSNFINTMLKLAAQKEEVNVVFDQLGSPTSSVDLAKCIIDLIHTENYGTYHATCEGHCSWYDLAKKIYELTGQKTNVKGITTEQLNRPAARPKYSVLDNFMLRLIGMNKFRHWEDSLKEYLKGEKMA